MQQEAKPVNTSRKTAKRDGGRTQRRWRLLRRFRRNSDGGSIIEFGLVAGPFFALMIAIFETTLIFFTQSALETGIANAGRAIRTGQVQADGVTEAQFKAMVCDSLAGYLDCNNKVTVDVRSFSDFSSIALPDALGDDGEVSGATEFTPGDASEVVVVRAFYVWDMLTPDYFTGMANMSGARRLLGAATAFRNEPF